MLKNVAGQIASFKLISKSNGDHITVGPVPVWVVGDNGTAYLGAGSVTHKVLGTWYYYPTQSETNYDHVTFTPDVSSAIPTKAEYYTTTDSKLQAVYDRIVAQVPSGPVDFIPSAPTSGQTTYWAYCYNSEGSPVEGITHEFMVIETNGGTGSYTRTIQTEVSDSVGIVEFSGPRNPKLKMALRREGGDWIYFSGVNQPTYEMPVVLGPK